MTLDRKEASTMNELQKQHFKKFLLKLLALIPIALLGWLLGMNSPMGTAIPVIILVGGVVILAIDSLGRYKADKRSAYS